MLCICARSKRISEANGIRTSAVKMASRGKYSSVRQNATATAANAGRFTSSSSVRRQLNSRTHRTVSSADDAPVKMPPAMPTGVMPFRWNSRYSTVPTAMTAGVASRTVFVFAQSTTFFGRSAAPASVRESVTAELMYAAEANSMPGKMSLSPTGEYSKMNIQAMTKMQP